VSLSMMLVLELPPQITRILLLAQNDPRGSSAERLCRRVIERWRGQGRSVALLPPPVFVKDLNELLIWKRERLRGIDGR
jgi:hypothetical protein